MRVIHDTAELAAREGGAFVPTMGALHEGHLALLRRARSLGRPLVVSIFVNPAQFGPGEDWQRYPRALEADLEAVSAEGVDVAFVPDVETVYPPGQEVAVPALPEMATRPGLEDAHRPGHFAGVCQVVSRLFDLVKPSVSVFGEKDYQQLLVVTALVRRHRDRWPGLRIVPHATVREAGGLARSSRNAYLGPQEREQARGLYEALRAARRASERGGDPPSVEEAMRAVLTEHRLGVDYGVVRDAETLEPVTSFARPSRGLVAARLGDVRLIDNMEIEGVRS